VLECPDEPVASLRSERIATVESGANAQIVAGSTASKTEPFGLRLTDGGETIGAITATFFPANQVFKFQSFVDADCHAGQVASLAQPGAGPLVAIPNWTEVRIDLLGRSYVLSLGAGTDIRVNFSPFAS